MQSSILLICNQIVIILESVNETYWKSIFNRYIIKLRLEENKEILQEILKTYKGMGSFNDLVLYNNGKLCNEENTKLNILREKLYAEIKNKF